MTTELLKQVEGQITSINHEKRGVAIKDKAGDTHPFYWSENVKMINNKGDELKQWWFIRVVAEKGKDDTWWITSQSYFQRPEDWPTSGGRKPTGQYQPRNERLIVLQSCAKLAADVYMFTTVPMFSDVEVETPDFDTVMDEIIARAIKDTNTFMKEGGSS